jgi:dissimilatory sulfite reductase (desulfoviridin) alpha/beta subunit
MGPPFVRMQNQEIPLQTRLGTKEQLCQEMALRILSGEIRPKYIIVSKFTCRGSTYCQQACLDSISSLYSLEETFPKVNDLWRWVYPKYGVDYILVFKLN